MPGEENKPDQIEFKGAKYSQEFMIKCFHDHMRNAEKDPFYDSIIRTRISRLKIISDAFENFIVSEGEKSNMLTMAITQATLLATDIYAVINRRSEKQFDAIEQQIAQPVEPTNPGGRREFL